MLASTSTATHKLPVVSPTLLKMWVAADRASLQRLLDDPELEVSDTLEDQLAELVQTRSPNGKLTAQEISEAVAELVGPRPAIEYGTWVHFPWSRRLVHLLPPDEFIELRTSRNRYLITEAEQATLAMKRVGIVGLSVGQSVALAMALERGAGELRLADFDTLELSNLNRLRSSVHDIGLPKVAIAARAIAELDPYLQVRCFFDGLTEANAERFFTDGGQLDLVVDECDGLDMKVRLREWARKLRIPVVMQTSDRGLLDIERFDLEPERAFFHGLAGDLRASDLVGLTNEQKVPHVLKILGVDGLSTRMRASLLEVEQSIRTWPQLGSAVTMGGGVAADAARRILLGQLHHSGRFYVDLGELLGETPPPTSNSAPELVSEATIRKLVGRAILAPSGGNHQPWRWIARGNQLELREDSAHHMGLTDFDNLGTAVALGAAAESLVLAAHAEGLEVRTAAGEEAGEVVATFELGATGEGLEPHAHDGLESYLELRHTDRRLGDRAPLTVAQREVLHVAARSVEGVELRLVTERPQIEELATLIGQGDRLRILDPGLSREMFAELRGTRAEAEATGDGLEVDSLALSAADRAGLELCREEALELVAKWGLGSGLSRLGEKWASASSALGLLIVRATLREGYFRGGRAMQRLWLAATRQGLVLHPLTFLPYAFARLQRGGGRGLGAGTVRGLAELRARYAELLGLGLDGTEGEVLLFRLFRAQGGIPPALRRPIDAVLRGRV